MVKIMGRIRKLTVTKKELEDSNVKKYTNYHGYYKITSNGIRVAFFKGDFIVYLTMNRKYEVVSRYAHDKYNLKAVDNLNRNWTEQNFGKLWSLSEKKWAKWSKSPMSTYMLYMEKNASYKAVHRVGSEFYQQTLVRMKPMLKYEKDIVEAIKDSINKTNC